MPGAAVAHRRADAVRNAGRILDAAVVCLARDAGASMSAIAAEAGVGRVTLYAHFPSREALVDAALEQVLTEGDEVLGALDLSGDAGAAMRRLVESSWEQIARTDRLVDAVQESLPSERVRQLHARHERRVRDLVRRGQREGAFRDDLPAGWLAGVLHHLLKGMALDVREGRVPARHAARYVADTLLGAYTAPGPGG